MDGLFTQLCGMNVFTVAEKCSAPIGNIDIYSMIYNLGCIKIKLNNKNEVLTIANTLMQSYHNGLIDIDDIDIIDILLLYYHCEKYKIVQEYFPNKGFVINEKILALKVNTLFKLGMYADAKRYYEEAKKEIDKISDNSIKKNLSLFDLNYNDAISNKSVIDLEAIPKIMESNYLYY